MDNALARLQLAGQNLDLRRQLAGQPQGDVVTLNGQPYLLDRKSMQYLPFTAGTPQTPTPTGPSPAQQRGMAGGQGPIANPALAAPSATSPNGGPGIWGKIGGTAGKQALTPEQARSLLGQLQQSDATMRAYEEKVKAPSGQLGLGASIAAGASGAEHPMEASHGSGVPGAFNAAARFAGNAALGRLNPDYQNYLTAQNAFGDAAIRVPMGSGARYSAARQRVETALSGLAPGDIPATIDYRQQRRQEVMAALGGMVGGPTGTSSTASQGGPPDPLLTKYPFLAPP